MSTLLLFPSVIHRVPPSFDFKDRKKEIVEYVYDKKRKDSVGVKKTNIGGWQSAGEYMVSEDNILQDLIISSVSTYFCDTKLFKKEINAGVDLFIKELEQNRQDNCRDTFLNIVSASPWPLKYKISELLKLYSFPDFKLSLTSISNGTTA